MHIFRSFDQFGQMCTGECKSAANSTFLPHPGRLSSVSWMP
jgi:hypothetical protein